MQLNKRGALGSHSPAGRQPSSGAMAGGTRGQQHPQPGRGDPRACPVPSGTQEPHQRPSETLGCSTHHGPAQGRAGPGARRPAALADHSPRLCGSCSFVYKSTGGPLRVDRPASKNGARFILGTDGPREEAEPREARGESCPRRGWPWRRLSSRLPCPEAECGGLKTDTWWCPRGALRPSSRPPALGQDLSQRREPGWGSAGQGDFWWRKDSGD